MPYCPNCGAQITSDMNFCPSCGARTNGADTSSVTSYTGSGSSNYESSYETNNYSVYLYSCGKAGKKEVAELLMDIIGYTETEAYNIVNYLPCEVAAYLTREQAVTICQVFAEYGAEVTIGQNGQTVHIDDDEASQSVFSNSGNLLAGAAAILAALTAANHISRIYRWDRPASFWDYLFRPRYRYDRPIHMRRSMTPPPPQPRRQPGLFGFGGLGGPGGAGRGGMGAPGGPGRGGMGGPGGPGRGGMGGPGRGGMGGPGGPGHGGMGGPGGRR